MIIGTVRPEEARVYDAKAGFHQFHTENQQLPYGSFEVFWNEPKLYGECLDPDDDPVKPGWYWWSCYPGCLPDSEPSGPFAYSQQAHEDADEWSPDYD